MPADEAGKQMLSNSDYSQGRTVLDDDGNPWPAAVECTIHLSRPEPAESMDDNQSISSIHHPDEPQMNIDQLCSFAIGHFLQLENRPGKD